MPGIPLKTKNVHSLCIVGAAADLSAHLGALLDDPLQRLDAQWTRTDQAVADLLLIDADSVYGHMDWLRAQSSGRPLIACTHTPEGYPTARHLRKPIDADDFVAVLNQVSAMLDAQPKSAAAQHLAPRAREATPAPERAALPEPPAAIAEAPPAPPRDPDLLDLLDADSALRGKTCLVAPGLPSLFIDPQARQWHADASLKALAGWCTRALAAGDVQTMSDAQFATAVATLPGHPQARLTWLAHLSRGAGQLAPGLDPNGRYRLARWPQSEREFPKHFRIATVMLKQAASVEEIAEQSGAAASDVADFINAYQALGFVEHDAPTKAPEDTRRGGLFGRGKKLSSN